MDFYRINVEFTRNDKGRRSPMKHTRSNHDLSPRERHHSSRSFHDNREYDRDNHSSYHTRSYERRSPRDYRVDYKVGSSRERLSPFYDDRRETRKESSFERSKRRRYSSSSSSGKSRSPIIKQLSPSLSRSSSPPQRKVPKLGLVERLRLKAELEKRGKEIEDGEILSDIENYPVKTSRSVSTACETIHESSSTLNVCNNVKSILFDSKQNSKDDTNSFGSDFSEETDSETLKAFASPPSEREELLEDNITTKINGQDVVVVQSS
uniref:RRM domain-containing protein n=1 Tax=Panagrolaimus sp. JU765 TaxID=591449 RepID=A0AC34QXD2_9BILA